MSLNKFNVTIPKFTTRDVEVCKNRLARCPRHRARKVLRIRFHSSSIPSQAQESSTMAQPKRVSKRKRQRTTLPVFGAAGVSLAMAGGASATAPTTNVPSQDTPMRPVITLGEEEISDVSLATFYVFDKENARIPQAGVQLAWRGCGCRGCGCRACRACRACRCGGCGCGGCGCGCCLSWGACRFC